MGDTAALGTPTPFIEFPPMQRRTNPNLSALRGGAWEKMEA
jgi:hypothetical protein